MSSDNTRLRLDIDLGTSGQAEADPLGHCVIGKSVRITPEECGHAPDKPQELRITPVVGVSQESTHVGNRDGARSLPESVLIDHGRVSVG